MNRLRTPLCIGRAAILLPLFLCACAQQESPDPFPAATPKRVVAVTNAIFPAVVRIDVAQEFYIDGKRDLQTGVGSGVIIDAQGHILTNYHVAGRAAELYVTLANKERVPAKLIGDDHWTDLAIIQLDMDAIRQKNITFSFAQLGQSSTLVTGQDVLAIGTPFGLARTMTRGIVSNTERTFYPDRIDIDNYETGDFSNWIQMDTPLNPGNSGGPLVDMNGKVVGINTRALGQNLNFAIPIDTARAVIAQIEASAGPGKIGKVVRSDLGIDLKPLQDLERFYALDINTGVLINSVEAGSPAAIAGVRTQDILLEINGQAVNVRFPEELAQARCMIADLPIGSSVSLTVKRDRDVLHLTARTQKLQGAIGEEREMKTWGMSVREITRKYAREQRLDDDLGVLVTSISPAYPAAQAELHAGDVIRAVNNTPVTDLDEFAKLYDASIAAKQTQILLDIQRNRGRQLAVLKID